MTDEAELIRQAREGHPPAQRALVEHNKERLYYLCLDLTGRHHDAEDLSQEVFIKAFGNLSQFRGDAQFSSWLHRIAVNTHLNQRRKKSVMALRTTENMDALDWETGAETTNPEDHAQSSLIQRHVDQALDRLSDKERCVFVLRHYQDFQLGDIAQIMDVSEGSVKSMLFRGVRKLQKALAFYKRDLGLESSHAEM